MALQDPQVTLDLLYAARNDLLSGKVQSYSIGDRNITLLDMTALDKLISKYENIISSGTPVQADLGGMVHMPFFPEG